MKFLIKRLSLKAEEIQIKVKSKRKKNLSLFWVKVALQFRTVDIDIVGKIC